MQKQLPPLLAIGVALLFLILGLMFLAQGQESTAAGAAAAALAAGAAATAGKKRNRADKQLAEFAEAARADLDTATDLRDAAEEEAAAVDRAVNKAPLDDLIDAELARRGQGSQEEP